jgi:hypothetical protein
MKDKIRRGPAQIGQDCFECGSIAMNIGNDCEAQCNSFVAKTVTLFSILYSIEREIEAGLHAHIALRRTTISPPV